MTTPNPLLTLRALGQSVWLDYIRRNILTDGTLRRLIVEDGLSGLTSNPAIFQKAIAAGEEYRPLIAKLISDGLATYEIYETLAIDDVRGAADEFRGVYDQTRGRDGYVSLEVSPGLAHDTAGTIEEGMRLWTVADRPNLMIKVPGTQAGLGAVRKLIAEGINVNVTLLFSVHRYSEVLNAWMSGLEDRRNGNESIANIASVASFFLSRIDSAIDPKLDLLAKQGNAQAASLRGRAAIVSAKLAYQLFKRTLQDPRWQYLERHGAMPQRLLWASTSTKDTSYPDVRYVEELVGPHTVNTVPLETLEAYRDHGHPELQLEQGLEVADSTQRELAGLGIDLSTVAEELEIDGIKKFVDPFEKLIATIEEQCRAA